jgi:hypothetical protein
MPAPAPTRARARAAPRLAHVPDHGRWPLRPVALAFKAGPDAPLSTRPHLLLLALPPHAEQLQPHTIAADAMNFTASASPLRAPSSHLRLCSALTCACRRRGR